MWAPRPAYFFAHQFGLSGGSNGYIGLQGAVPLSKAHARHDVPRLPTGDTDLFNGTQVGRGCIFSIWQSLNATALDSRAVCGVFGGEGTGYSCRIPFEWRDGKAYDYHLFRVAGANVSDTWFAASVEDVETQVR